MELIEINSIPTEFYWKKSKEEHSRKLVVIPGNPGVIDFYITFIDNLFDRFDQKYDVIGVAHAGHSGLVPHIYSVEDQITHKIHVLDYLTSIFKKPKFVLMGHSVGAYISLKVVKRRPDFGIKHVVNLFPTIRHLWNGLAPAVKLFILPGFRNTLSTLIHYAPTALTRTIISLVSSISDEARYVAANKINYHLVMNILYMAYTEGQDIIEIDEECNEAIKNNLTTMYFLYGPTDQYTPKHFYEEIRIAYPLGNFEMAEDGVKHAFVLQHSDVVAGKVHCFLSKAFDLDVMVPVSEEKL